MINPLQDAKTQWYNNTTRTSIIIPMSVTYRKLQRLLTMSQQSFERDQFTLEWMDKVENWNINPRNVLSVFTAFIEQIAWTECIW